MDTAPDDVEIDDIVGIREAAAALNVNPSTISRQVKKGAIPNRGTPSSPKVSLSEARQARTANLDPAQQRRAPSPAIAQPASGSFSSHRTSHEETKAKLAALDLAERLGRVVSKTEAEDLFATFGQRVRVQLERRWRELGTELQGLLEPEIVARGIASTEEVLAGVAAEIEKDWPWINGPT